MNWLDRQSFLGSDSNDQLDELTICISGLGGGGSHVALQAAHVGVGGFVLVDDDIIDETNLNRLVGGTREDVDEGISKVDIAARIISAINPDARITPLCKKWQEATAEVQRCDVVFGCVDNVRCKDELEDFCRRLMIPYIDQGMDVHEMGDHFMVAGQVVLSVPGAPCLRCLGIVTEEALENEGRNYGAAGGKPQVVWPNGVLASTAMGLFMQLVVPWHSSLPAGECLEYDGNMHTVHRSDRMRLLRGRLCPHRSTMDLGDPTFDIRRFVNEPASAAKECTASATEQRWLRWLVGLLSKLGLQKRS